MMAIQVQAFRGHLRLQKVAAAVIAAALSLGTLTAIAVQDTGASTASTAECNSFKEASKTAMLNQLSVVNTFMSAGANQMQAAVSKKNSCIGNLALLDFDMSKLIPDFGLLGGLLSRAVDSLVNGVINRACAAMSSVLDKPAEVWNDIMGRLNINGQFQDWSNGIDYKIPGVGTGSGSGTGSGPVPTTPIGGIDTGTPDPPYIPPGGGGDSPNGAEIGARFGELLVACQTAMRSDEESGNGTSASTIAACKELQSFIDRYRTMLDPRVLPVLPPFVLGKSASMFGGGADSARDTNGSSGPSATGGKSTSLPVRE